MFRFDLHVHTSEVSFCGQVCAAETVERYVNAGYAGFVLTDHYNPSCAAHYAQTTWEGRMEHFLQGYRLAKARGEELGFDVLSGMELAMEGAPDEFLLYGLTEEFLLAHPMICTLDAQGLRQLADENGILIFQAHPFRPHMTPADKPFLDGVEVYNGNPRHHSRNELAAEYAVAHGLLCSSGSDAHCPEDVGRGGLLTAERITTPEQLKSALRSLKTPEGNAQCSLIRTLDAPKAD